ncbi:MAG: hemolysin [Ignavibacteria bacterium]|nr:MAG: hemolysin [Ignavibacteria bacterium]KAF0160892.1 MAG: hemolysin [Ignavibacteria bacterium]
MNNKMSELIFLKINFGETYIGKAAKKVVTGILTKILYLNRIENFIKANEHLDEKQFIGHLFDDLNFSYLISSRDFEKIPSHGKIICVANHPIGSLDALSILKAVLEIRKDVKVVANEVLSNIEQLRTMFIPLKLDSKHAQKNAILAVQKALHNEQMVIIFPAATVSRLNGIKITDSRWHKGAVHFAKRFSAPILPVFIEARNSFLFYFTSIVSKKLSTFLLAHELFNKRNKTIQLKIGDVIPAKVFTASIIDENYQTMLLRKHVYLLGKNRKGIYSTEKNVIHPVDRKAIKLELASSRLLGITHNNMKIYLTTKIESPQTVNEIARLRELTFRKVGEGTGRKLDIDKFDSHYSHLVVWDENELEIIGAYRIGSGNYIMDKIGENGFYTSTLFNFSKDFSSGYLKDSIELGRSFVQSKYWNSNALNYLWQGIGAYLQHYPSVRYLFGGVSISNNYPNSAKEMIITYFNKWYGYNNGLVESKRKFVMSEATHAEYFSMFVGESAKDDYRILKTMLKPLGFKVPVLYKHYSELCEAGGVKFLDFGIDPDFENCVDGLILVDISLIKEEKKQKFIASNSFSILRATA